MDAAAGAKLSEPAAAPEPPRSRALRYALAGPPAATLLLLAAVAAAETRGLVLVGSPPVDDLADAISAGEAATVMRLIGDGDDPTRVRAVRPELGAAWATPLEVAVLARDPEMLRLLDRLGAVVGDQRRHLACAAADIGEDRIAADLMPGGVSCEAGAAIGAIRRRTR